jgi:hypothetical protein
LFAAAVVIAPAYASPVTNGVYPSAGFATLGLRFEE